MIKLYQFPPLWDLPNVSPFCMKLETYLRMTNLPFQIVQVNDPRKSPKGKFPFIKDEGFVVSDSGLIIEYLKEKYGDVLDANLTPLQKAQALTLQRMLEEHLHWTIVYSRWVDLVNWPRVKQDFFSRAPFIVRRFVSEMLRKNIIRTLHEQGIGRHTPYEIEQMGLKDLDALHAILNNKPFLMGAEPTSIDACGYAFIANIMQSPLTSKLTEYVKSQTNFVDYCARMKQRYYK